MGNWRRAWGLVGWETCESFDVIMLQTALTIERSRIMKGLLLEGGDESLQRLVEGIEQL